MERACLLRSVFREKARRATQQKILNHHETEDGNMSLTEEARGDPDRLGVADDR